MKIFTQPLRSQKYKGLQIAVVVFDDGSKKLVLPKPEAGETVAKEIRKIQERSEKYKKNFPIG